MLLSGFTTDYKQLLYGVNIGGLGTLIASMASLAVFMSAKYPIGQHTISGSVGFLKSKWKGAETSVGHDEGTMTMAGLVYYYNFSKRTNFYGAASWSDGKKLLDGVDRFNQVLTAVGLMHRF